MQYSMLICLLIIFLVGANGLKIIVNKPDVSTDDSVINPNSGSWIDQDMFVIWKAQCSASDPTTTFFSVQTKENELTASSRNTYCPNYFVEVNATTDLVATNNNFKCFNNKDIDFIINFNDQEYSFKQTPANRRITVTRKNKRVAVSEQENTFVHDLKFIDDPTEVEKNLISLVITMEIFNDYKRDNNGSYRNDCLNVPDQTTGVSPTTGTTPWTAWDIVGIIAVIVMALIAIAFIIFLIVVCVIRCRSD